MSPIWSNIIGVVTIALMVLFIGIWIWAWQKRHKPVFDRMAALPVEEEEDEQGTIEKNAGDDTP